MSEARYWRIVGVEAQAGGDLELSEIALYVGASRADGAATLTCSHTPIAGSLADLKDGSMSTACRFAAAAVRSPGFFLQWDFGADTDVSEIALGSSDNADRFLAEATLMQGASVGVWSYAGNFSGAVYPGAGAMTTSGAPEVLPTRWNQNDKGSACTLSNGDLTATGYATNGSARSVFGASSGKLYWECSSNGDRYPVIGVGRAAASLGTNPGEDSDGWAYYGLNAKKIYGGVQTNYGTAWDNQAHIVGVALDMDNGNLEFFKSGVSMGVAFSGITGSVYAMTGGDTDSYTSNVTANFGASAFAFPPPAGYAAGLGQLNPKLPLSAAPILHTSRSSFAIAASAPVPPLSTRSAARLQLARDVVFGGAGTVYGTTKAKGTGLGLAISQRIIENAGGRLEVTSRRGHGSTFTLRLAIAD